MPCKEMRGRYRSVRIVQYNVVGYKELMWVSVRAPNSHDFGFGFEVRYVLINRFPNLLIARVEHVAFPHDVFPWVTVGLELVHYATHLLTFVPL